MWSLHRMCQRRSSTLSLNRNGESHLLGEKSQIKLHRQSPPPGTSSTRRGRPGGGKGARARVPGLPGHVRNRFGFRVVVLARDRDAMSLVLGVRSGQRNPQWTKITPGIAGLAAGSHARRPALSEIREFRKAIPRPRRGSELVFGGPRAAKSSVRCVNTHLTTGDPHVSRMYACPLAWPLRQKPLATRRGLLAALPAQSVRVSTTGHQGSQYLLQGKRAY
jgi:hypothetical protein